MTVRLKVLVVDDSALARSVISRKLAEDPEIQVAGTASNGAEAVAQVLALRPDVVTLDVQMPGMDGLEALSQIMAKCPTPVVMLSSLTGEDTATTIRALELGAVDFFLKGTVAAPIEAAGSGKRLTEVVKTAASVRRSMLVPRNAARATPARDRTAVRRSGLPSKLVVVASSTGGPSALIEVVPHLPGGLDAGYLLVQHMPAGFTRSLAERLDRASQVEVREAIDGDQVQAGLALMAPGGFHMDVGGDGCIRLLQTPPVHGVRPAADVTMQAVAKLSGRNAVGVVLTGMGMDGTAGSGHIRAAGGVVIAQDESTCTVYGMPKMVVDAGHADVVAPIGRVANEIVGAVRDNSSEAAG